MSTSEANVELLRRGFEAYGRGDLDAVVDVLAPDVEWRPAIAPILGVEVIKGRDAVRRFLAEDLFEGFDHVTATPLSMEAAGDEHVIVMTHYVGRGESSGLAMDQMSASLYRVQDGKAVSMCDYETREEALEAAGLAG